MSKNHNKKRNTALLWEFLVRHISKCIIENKKEEAKKAINLSKRYFSKKSPLFYELKLFDAVLDTTVKSTESAHKILNEIYRLSRKINVREVDASKSKLIKEINYTFDKDQFYGCKVPNYVVYASLQTLINEVKNKKKNLNALDKIKLEERIVDYLVKENKQDPSKLFVTNPDYNNVVYKLVIKKFYDKYSNKLNEDQRKLLTKYVVYLISENASILQASIEKEVKKAKQVLKSIRDKNILEDKDLMKKMNECYKRLVVTNFDIISEENIIEVLKYMSLVNEVNS